MEIIQSDVLVVVSYMNQSVSFRITMNDSFETLRGKVVSKWQSLMNIDFDICYDVNGDKKYIKTDFDIQSLCSLYILKNEDVIQLYISTDPTSSFPNNEDFENGTLSVTPYQLTCNLSDQPQIKTSSWRYLINSVGQIFEGGAVEFRIALTKFAIQNGFKIKYSKNDCSRITTKCVGDGSVSCTWFVHGAPINSYFDTFGIKKLINEHRCGYGVRDLSRIPISGKLVKSLILNEVRDRPAIRPKDIQSTLRRDYGIHASYYYAQKGKELASADVFGSHDDSFSKLPSYVDALRRTNPGSHVVLEIDPKSQKFYRIFVAFEACIDELSYIRPLIFVDATFLTGRYKGTLFAATGLDGQGEMYHICFGISDSENDTNWRWFLDNLKVIIPFEDDITFLSDRHKGIIHNIPLIFPNSFHGFCLYHLKNNLRCCLSRSKKADYTIRVFERCCYASTHQDFTKHWDEFIGLLPDNSRIQSFLNGLLWDCWVDVHFRGQRYGRVCSSLAESFNNWIRELKDFPIVPLIDGIRKKVMNMRSKRRDHASEWVGILCPKVENILKERILEARGMHANKSNDGLFEVFHDGTYRVDLVSRECSCNLWRIKGVPCLHALFCLLSTGQKIEDFYQPYFRVNYYRHSYYHAVHPVIDQPAVEDEIVDRVVKPPDVKRTPGRPKKTRYPSRGSESTCKRARVCSKCNSVAFHNKRTCHNSFTTADQ